MSAGRLIAVVGSSGVGKDSVINALVARLPRLCRARRVITRPAGPGEEFDPVSPERFEAMRRDGAFCLVWQAHGLSYGIPAAVETAVAAGHICIANLSRGVLPEAAARFGQLTVLHVTATPEVLARRLATRGRESAADIEARLARRTAPLPAELEIVEIDNSGALTQTVQTALAALQPALAAP